MEKDPHQLIEGVLIACYAIGAAQAFLYVRGEMALAQERIAQALNDAYAAGYIGKNILGTDFSVDVVLHWGAGAYIVGEETALIESLEGNRGMPRLKPPFFPAAKGLYLQPTVVNNVETLANLPWIIDQRRRQVRRARRRDEQRACACSRCPGHVQQPRRVRGGVRRHHLPRPASTRPSTAAASATATSSRRSSPAAAPRRGSTRSTSTCRSSRRRRPGRLDARLGRHRRDGRHHRHGEGVLAARAVLRPRVVRQVHAVPRGHQLAREGPAPHRSTATAARTTSTCCSTCATTSAPARPRSPAMGPSRSRTADHDLPARPVGGVADRRRRSCASATSSQALRIKARRRARARWPVSDTQAPAETVLLTVNGKEIEAAARRARDRRRRAQRHLHPALLLPPADGAGGHVPDVRRRDRHRPRPRPPARLHDPGGARA